MGLELDGGRNSAVWAVPPFFILGIVVFWQEYRGT